MVKKESLMDDLDFVKEFEELKLKQKLLIETIKNKNVTQMNQYLIEMNSKLDFLVKIFKEANTQNEENEFSTKLDEINTKISTSFEEFEKKINSKFDLFEEKFDKINFEISKTENLVQKEIKDTQIAPLPTFKVDISNPQDKKIDSNVENKIDTVLNNQEEQKIKKKWF